MGSQKTSGISSGASLSLKTKNKSKRQELWARHKQTTSKQRKRDRLSRRKEEDRDPELRRERLQKNIPSSIDKKRIWDDTDDDSLGALVDVAQVKRRRVAQEEQERGNVDADLSSADLSSDNDDDDDDELDSMFDSEEEDNNDDSEPGVSEARMKKDVQDASLGSSIATNFDLTPASLTLKFPTLFVDGPARTPKILVTTSLHSTLHEQARTLCSLFPNAHYTPRSRRGHGNKHAYSLRDISKFATNREFTSVLVLNEDQKPPSGIDIVHLPSGPTLSFSISTFVEGKKLPGHGKPTDHRPELLLNNFKTPLGLLTAKVFQTLFGPAELAGRTVVCVHNQRDYLFLRRYRYIYRDKKVTEKPAVSADGKEIPGGVRVGLQTIGPNIHMKLRNVYRGIGRAGSEGEDGVQWEWKAKMEKQRTRFQL